MAVKVRRGSGCAGVSIDKVGRHHSRPTKVPEQASPTIEL